MVIEPLANQTEIDLVVNENGTAALFYMGRAQHSYAWVEYDPERKELHLITEDGQTQDIGIKIAPIFDTIFHKTNALTLIEVNTDLSCHAATQISFKRLAE